ncbi:TPA: phage tail protein [Escherichia coli]|uniref:phage tail protein n=2 Tax=Escherichia coli TaxID=562 RepID=UPI000BE4370A|nr:phage tail protein [Escherichia coli]PDO64784.1 phage tail protein [Escherichia coli]HEA9078469.1 phage tail protein [Escherichia coli]HEA9083180.1 phage tail protein [Escherichia coli]HEA9529610.1 phage tail protein [Escherichia coli]HEA9681465.1 phage tail protein [Escherichia coli]
MTVKYYAILTNQGAARLANATMLGSKLNLTQMAVGDANGVLPTPDPAQTKLINQKRIAPLNLLSVDPKNQSQIIAEQIIPENEGGFWIREIGLYDDEGVLIAVANCPETYKPQLQEGSGRTQTIRMILVVTNTEAITLKIDPSVVLATRKYVDDEVLELRLYVDEQMRNHIAAQDPHTQYAQKHNPTFTGEPKAPTPAAGNNTTRIATTAFVQAAITALINGAPATLDTLKEIAAAINNDPKFSTTINNALSGKQPLDETLTHLSGKDVAGLLAYLGLGEAAKRNVGNGENQIPDMSFWTVTGGNGNFVIRQPDGLIIQMVTVSISGPVAMNGMTDNAYAITGSNKSYIATATLPFVFPNKVLGVIPLVSTTAYGGVSSNITGSYATAVCSFAAVRGNNTIVFKVDKPLNAAFPSDTSVSALIIGR